MTLNTSSSCLTHSEAVREGVLTVLLFGIVEMFTGVVGHRRLLAVPLLLKLDVAQLEHSGHHLQHPCSEEEETL